jgi:hypothetical protein
MPFKNAEDRKKYLQEYREKHREDYNTYMRELQQRKKVDYELLIDNIKTLSEDSKKKSKELETSNYIIHNFFVFKKGFRR